MTTLTLVCAKCTRENTYRGEDQNRAWDAARKAGWVIIEGQKAACPKCPARRVVK